MVESEADVVSEGLSVLPDIARKVQRVLRYPEVSDLVSEGFYQIGLNYRRYDPCKGSVRRFWWGVLYRRLLLFVVTGDSWIGRKQAVEFVDIDGLYHLASVPALERQILATQVLAPLDPDDQVLLWAKYAEEWRVRELLPQWGLTEAGLRTRLHRLKQDIRYRQCQEIASNPTTRGHKRSSIAWLRASIFKV